jgi:hypothetical protein
VTPSFLRGASGARECAPDDRLGNEPTSLATAPMSPSGGLASISTLKVNLSFNAIVFAYFVA